MTDNSQAFAALIHAARMKNGLSVRRAASAADMSEGRWRQLERGYQQLAGGVRVAANPRESTVVAIAAALGIPVDEALRAAGYDYAADRVGPTPHSAEESDGEEEILFRLPPDLTARQREHARKLAEASVRAYLETLDDDD